MSALSAARAMSRAKMILLSATAIGVTATMAGLGSFATFTDTETGSTAIDSGVVSIAIGASGADNRLSVAATDIVPGDTIQRAVKLSVDSTTTDDLASITLTTTASPSSKLDTDATNGLQLVIDRCTVAWTETETDTTVLGDGPFTYACSGTTSSVLASRAIIGSGLSLSNLGVSAGSVNHLRVTGTLPTTADNTFQNLASTVQYAFTGNQRAAKAQ